MKNNIDGNFLKVINHMYSQAKSCIISGSDKSEMFDCNIGVRQGENLSPILFALFLNDFEEQIFQNDLPGYNNMGLLKNTELPRRQYQSTHWQYSTFHTIVFNY